MIFLDLLLFCTYFAPSWVALYRDHHKALTIFLLNLCFGWTVIGWLALVVWAWLPKKAKDA